MLLSNYFTSAWRNILRHKLFSFINIFGLAIGLAAVMLIALYVRYETSYDNFWKNADNIYRTQIDFAPSGVGSAKFATVPGIMRDPFIQYFPQIENSTLIIPRTPSIKYGEQHFQDDVQLVEANISDIFNFQILQGNINTLTMDNASLAINHSTAQKYFGTDNPIDQILTIDFGQYIRDYKVAVVFEDIPDNSMLKINIMAPLDRNDWDGHTLLNAWLGPESYLFYTLPSGFDIDQINKNMPDFINKNVTAYADDPNLEKSDFVSIKSVNIKDIHLKAEGNHEMGEKGSLPSILIFSTVSIFILIIAAFNFINLSTARAGMRAKEVSMRKTFGAKQKDLIRQFLGESIFMAFISLFIALSAVELILPYYNDYLNKQMMINYASFDAVIILITAIAIGLISGIYPAFVLSSFRPAKVLKANQSVEATASNKLRTALVISQFIISITLFVSTAVVYSQISYVSNLDFGFNDKNLLVIKTNNRSEVNEKVQSFIEQVKLLPNVVNATSSSHLPASTEAYPYYYNTAEMGEANNIMINVRYVGYDFFNTYSIPLLKGRRFDINRSDVPPSSPEIRSGDMRNGAIILNKSALRRFNFATSEDAIGQIIYHRRYDESGKVEVGLEIIGVIPDVHFDSLKNEVQPELYSLNWNYFREDWYLIHSITVRYAGDPIKAVKDVRMLWQQYYPTVNFSYDYVTDRMINQYTTEQNQMTMFAAFSGLAIFIACLGLFGLASFTAERRTKEIGIRKVFGAEVWQIVKLLVWQFSKPVLIANVIAWPVAYLSMSRWLESFVYRIDDIVIIVLCLVAGLTALLIAWATVAANSYTVARQNPIKSLRYE